MTNWRRAFCPGGTFFFTLVSERRHPILTTPEARLLLRKVIADCQTRWPLEIAAIVLLPEHLHTIWRLPEEDSDYSKRWGWIKKEFTKAWIEIGGIEQPVTDSRQRNRRRGVLQRRFWEHLIRDESDYERLVEYIHYNPVKHGHVACPKEWPWSSFHRYVRAGIYPQEWGCASLDFEDIEWLVGE